MNLKIICISIGILATELLAAQDQTTELSLEQVVKIARLESPDAQTARHSFRSAYWNYKYYRANYLPTLNLTSDPNLNRAINKITMGDGSVKFVEQNLLNTDLTLNLSQTYLGQEVPCFLKRPHNVWTCSANINIRGRLHLS